MAKKKQLTLDPVTEQLSRISDKDLSLSIYSRQGNPKSEEPKKTIFILLNYSLAETKERIIFSLLLPSQSISKKSSSLP